jgi:hypothetical protein
MTSTSDLLLSKLTLIAQLTQEVKDIVNHAKGYKIVFDLAQLPKQLTSQEWTYYLGVLEIEPTSTSPEVCG